MERLVQAALFLCACLCVARPVQAEALAVIDISARPDPDWRVHDRQLIVQLVQSLDSDGNLALKSMSEVDALFREPPEPQTAGMLTEAREQLRRGRELSSQLQPGQAIVLLQSALRALRAGFPELKDLKLLEEVHLQLGVTYQALGKTELAANEYRMVLLLDPRRVLDETVFNPMVIARFAEVKHQVQTELRGSLSLLSTPAGAQVVVDGRAVGETPITVPDVLPGEHYITIRRNGYRAWSGRMRVAPGDLKRQEVFLSPGQSMHWVHLVQRLRAASDQETGASEAGELAEALGVNWLVLVDIDHAEARTAVRMALFCRAAGRIETLGTFWLDDVRLAELADRLRSRVTSGGSVAQATAGDSAARLQIKGLPPPPQVARAPEESPDAWYRKWWFWTAVGVVALGAAATTTWILLPDSGVRIQAVR